LEKKGKMMSGWQKRWFVSSGHYLTYYKNEQKKELLCSIDLEQVDVIQPNGMATQGMFQIQVKGGKLMNLRAPTGMEAVAWCDDLQTFSDRAAAAAQPQASGPPSGLPAGATGPNPDRAGPPPGDPPGPPPGGPPVSAEVQAVREDLYQYYAARKPTRLHEVGAIMEQYAGKEQEVVQMLEQAKLADAQADSLPPPTAQTVDEIRDELRAYYQSRNPAKVDEVDAIMAQFEGREMEVVTMLQQAKLAEAQAAQAAGGGEAAAGEAAEAAAATAAGGQSVDSIRRELLAYYQSRNPAKAAQVDAIMAQYAGREQEVVDMLRKAKAAQALAQGPPPPAQSDAPLSVEQVREQLRDYYQRRNPAKVAEVDAIMAQFEGRETEVVKMLQKAEAAEAEAAGQAAGGGGAAAAGEAAEAAAATAAGGQSVDSIRRELQAYYQSRNPAKAAQVDAIMAQYAGREQEVVDMLRKAKAAEALAQGAASPPAAAAPEEGEEGAEPTAAPAEEAEEGGEGDGARRGRSVQSIKQELREYYEARNPAKVQEVDAIMAQYAGREEEVVKMLQQAKLAPPPGEGGSAAPSAPQGQPGGQPGGGAEAQAQARAPVAAAAGGRALQTALQASLTAFLACRLTAIGSSVGLSPQLLLAAEDASGAVHDPAAAAATVAAQVRGSQTTLEH
jgi:hypothetical protein